jgi:glycerol 3-phosphatase-2
MPVAPAFSGYDAFLLDLDGVIYRGNEPVAFAAEAVNEVISAGKRVAFLTNNSTVRPESVSERLRAMGIRAEPAQVVTSALATADSLRSERTASAFVIGEPALRDAIARAGIRVAQDGNELVDTVVVGLDRRVTYEAIRDAAVQIERGARFVATNADPSLPVPGGAWPGAGALVGAVQATTGVAPEIVGKPKPQLFRSALERAGGGKPLVVGDRLDTDVAGAVALGWDAALVLTGVSTREEASAPGAPKARFILGDLRGLLG